MKISQLTITDEEVAQAVQDFLLARYNIGVKVKRVHKRYSIDPEFEVDLDVVENVKAPEPAPPATTTLTEVPTEEEVKELNEAP